ncbi:Calponin-3 [Physocladia obscura]|uniref:Calponin-3 n=1 Tax=Physocladia obscura TaxID=109957 RepID=A0AAD5XF28_9FUNG|nr:Calponin-3 [Physocladia obscura]
MKAAAKHDPSQEQAARAYISVITNTQLPSETSLYTLLKDGTVLCDLVNKILLNLVPPIAPSIHKVHQSPMPFKQMENISAFLDRVEKLGVPAHERFMTVDLYECKNMNQVVTCIFSLSRHAAAKGFEINGEKYVLGPAMVVVRNEDKKTVSEDQLREAKNTPSKFMSFSSTSVTSSIGYRQIGGARI